VTPNVTDQLFDHQHCDGCNGKSGVLGQRLTRASPPPSDLFARLAYLVVEILPIQFDPTERIRAVRKTITRIKVARGAKDVL
jgi:hypothetical protein